MRNRVAIFYAKGGKSKIFFQICLSALSLIRIHLRFTCPSISVNYFTQNCQNHAKGKNSFNKHCAKEKAISYFNWLTTERRIAESGSTPLTEFNNLRLDYGDWNLSPSISKDETIKHRNQFLTEKI